MTHNHSRRQEWGGRQDRHHQQAQISRVTELLPWILKEIYSYFSLPSSQENLRALMKIQLSDRCQGNKSQETTGLPD